MQPEKREGVTGDGVTIEGPSVLDPDQNLYAQPPFETALWVVFQTSGVPQERLRQMTTHLARGLHKSFEERVPTNEQIREETGKLLYEEGLRLTFRRALHNLSAVAVEERGEASARIVRQLSRMFERYPLWYRYIAQVQRKNLTYLTNGEINTKKSPTNIPSEEIVPGYASWLEQRIQRENLMTSLTVETIFEEAADPQRSRAGGRGRGWKRWTFKTNDRLGIERGQRRLPHDLHSPPFPKPETRPEGE